MEKQIFRFAEQIVRLNQMAYEAYLPMIEDVCSRKVSED